MKKGLRLKMSVAALLVSVGVSAQSSLNTTLTDQLTISGGQTLANICGYTAPNGNEYALLGADQGMIIVDVTNPSSVTQIVQIPMVSSLWKEIKVYGHYAYVTTEGTGGALQIVDLNGIPATSASSYTYHTYTGDGAIAGQLSTVHALHIDTTTGYCYLFGTNLFSGGAVFLDLNTDPYNPTYAGKYDANGYVHDGYVDNDTLFAGHIYAGNFAMVDCSNKSNPVVLAVQTTPTAFTHNTWLSADRNYIFTTDENTNSFLAAYDVSNPSNIQEVDRIQSWNPNSGSIVHNTHVVGQNWAVTSWYKDGFVITDVTRPHNLVNVGWYDTFNGSGNGFEGDWGVYPYFPSGTIVVSNIDEGLYVFSPTYVRACYLEGNVYDSLCGTPLQGVTITISTVNVTETSSITGDYATGTPVPGTYTVTYTKPGYTTVVMNNVVFAPGQVNLFNVAMYAPGGFSLNGHVEDATTTTALPNVSVQVANASNSYLYNSDLNGDFTSCTVMPGYYDIVSAAWGYETVCTQDSVTPTSGLLNVQLDSGYEDEFTFDLGWTVTGNASSGVWERGEPIGTTYNTANDANPDLDVNNDCTDKCYITGNGGGAASQDDVDNGNTVLTSPAMDLSTYGDAWIHYSRWFFNDGGSGNPNDTMFVRVSNGITTVTLEKVHRNSAGNSSWQNRSYRLQNYITVTNNMHVIVEVRDFNGGHLVEGAFDNFVVADSNALSVGQPVAVNNGLAVYPNPFDGTTQVNYSVAPEQAGNAVMEIVDMTGRVVASSVLNSSTGTMTIGEALADGVYMVRVVNAGEVLAQQRVVKAK
jgi:choice-of-anchor B domain-containing protein